MDPTPIDAVTAPLPVRSAGSGSLGNRTKNGSRRIGERVLGWEATVVWRAEKRTKNLVRRATGAVPAQLLDVSVSGAQLEVELGRELPVGAVVGVTIDGFRAVVEVRRVQPGVTSRLRCYGVEWREVEPPLQHMIDQYLMRSEPVPDQRAALRW